MVLTRLPKSGEYVLIRRNSDGAFLILKVIKHKLNNKFRCELVFHNKIFKELNYKEYNVGDIEDNWDMPVNDKVVDANWERVCIMSKEEVYAEIL